MQDFLCSNCLPECIDRKVERKQFESSSIFLFSICLDTKSESLGVWGGLIYMYKQQMLPYFAVSFTCCELLH